jgi:hypothetical protein
MIGKSPDTVVDTHSDLNHRNIPPNMPPPIRRTPPSPTHRSLPRPEVEDVGEDLDFHPEIDPDSEPVGGGGISDAAFSPKYFERFFVTQRELGRGGKGVVLLVRHVLDGVSLGEFACKRVPVGKNFFPICGWIGRACGFW